MINITGLAAPNLSEPTLRLPELMTCQKVGVVGSSPDALNSNIPPEQHVIYVNGALEFAREKPMETKSWFVTGGILATEYVDAETDARQKVVRGARVNHIFASSIQDEVTIRKSLGSLEISFQHLWLLSPTILRGMLLSNTNKVWMLGALTGTRALRLLRRRSQLPRILDFLFRASGHKSIPEIWKPSGGVQAVLLATRLAGIEEIVLSGISLGHHSYFREGIVLSEGPYRNHEAIDLALLRALTRRSFPSLASTDKELARLTGMRWESFG